MAPSKEEARAILAKALGAMQVDEAEAWLSGGTYALTRFAENAIHQNVQERTFGLTVRAVVGKRSARAETVRLDDEGIRACAANAVRLARLSPADPEALPVLAEQGTYLPVEAYDAATAASTPEARAEAVKAVVDACAKAGARAAGAFTVVTGEMGGYGDLGTVAFLNSKGVFAFHASTSASFTVTVTAGEGSGWAHAESFRAGDLDPAALGRRALQKALASRETKDLAPGRYTVVLEPAALSEFCGYSLGGAFSALAVEEGRSPIAGKVGQRVAGENVTVVEDVQLLHARPFDEEGMPTCKVTLLERGMAKELVHDRKTAAKAGGETKPTGHAPRQPSGWGPHPRALRLVGGDGSVEDLVRGVERGVLVTRFWYTNTVDERQGLMTGMTRDGTFWIEKGEIRHALRNMRFNESILGVLSRIERLGAEVEMQGGRCPSAVVREFQFSSGTRF